MNTCLGVYGQGTSSPLEPKSETGHKASLFKGYGSVNKPSTIRKSQTSATPSLILKFEKIRLSATRSTGVLIYILRHCTNLRRRIRFVDDQHV